MSVAAAVEVGCTTDRECPDSQACENRLCTNPCYVKNPCSPLATCRARNHRAQCFCPPGMTGDGIRSCTPSMCPVVDLGSISATSEIDFFVILVKKGECESDAECSDREACIDHRCTNPCQEPFGPCGENAICTPASHTAICMCPVGWAGHAHEQCFQCECERLNLASIGPSRKLRE